MDETDCFFKALPEKGLAEITIQTRRGKKSKTILTIAFFANAAGEKVIEILVTWRSAKYRYFKTLKIVSVPMAFTITVTKNRG